jgi:hypothetical protein
MGPPEGVGAELGATMAEQARANSQGAAHAAPEALENANENSALFVESEGEDVVETDPPAE